VAGLAPQGTIEHLSYTAPRLTEVFRDVVGASITDLEAARHADGDAEVAS
jgi:ABC-2 type transport system ATP-binding protein